MHESMQPARAGVSFGASTSPPRAGFGSKRVEAPDLVLPRRFSIASKESSVSDVILRTSKCRRMWQWVGELLLIQMWMKVKWVIARVRFIIESEIKSGEERR